MIRVNEKYTICLDEQNYFYKDFEIDSLDDMYHGSNVVMYMVLDFRVVDGNIYF